MNFPLDEFQIEANKEEAKGRGDDNSSSLDATDRRCTSIGEAVYSFIGKKLCASDVSEWFRCFYMGFDVENMIWLAYSEINEFENPSPIQTQTSCIFCHHYQPAGICGGKNGLLISSVGLHPDTTSSSILISTPTRMRTNRSNLQQLVDWDNRCPTAIQLPKGSSAPTDYQKDHIQEAQGSRINQPP
uniref:Uncharacterized protein n=1 Tax=Leersia perrieri TaxID=77586 RepID=A0A0D9XS06_9ORYZ